MASGTRNILALGLCAVLAFALIGCEPTKPQPRQVVTIPDGEIDPAVWGKAYPEEYELWKKTAEPVATRRSKYKTGMDSGALTSSPSLMRALSSGWLTLLRKRSWTKASSSCRSASP